MWYRVTAASTFPVTLAEAQAQCRVDHNDDEALIRGLLAAANDVISQMVGYPLGVEDWAAVIAGKGPIRVPLYPVKSLVSVGNNLEGYSLTRRGDEAYISGPPISEPVTAKVEIGGEAAPALKQAMLMIISHWYENRETASEKPLKEIPFAVESLVGLYRRGWAAG